MNNLSRSILAVAILALPAVPVAAQQKMNMPGMNMPGMNAPATSTPAGTMPGMDMHETKSTAPYHPGLGELMTAFVQPRHIKLGLAGAAQNWDYAAYELGELQEAFDDAGKLVLKHGSLSIPDAIAATVKPPLAALDAAIKAKDPAAFTKAYGDLTTACNACHQSADHKMIVIQVPSVSGTAFPDQDFNPPK